MHDHPMLNFPFNVFVCLFFCSFLPSFVRSSFFSISFFNLNRCSKVNLCNLETAFNNRISEQCISVIVFITGLVDGHHACGIESNDTPNQIFLSFQQRTVGQTTPSVTVPLCGSGSEYPRNVVDELLLAIKELAPQMDTGIYAVVDRNTLGMS